MCSEFYRFYESAIKGPTLIIDWKTIQQQFRIKEKRFPSDKRILEYFNSNFLTNISESSRSKWHRMDKLLFIWVVVHYCDMKNRNITRVERNDFEEFSKVLGVSQRVLETKWVKLAKPSLKKLPWEQHEERLLNELMMSELANRWTDIALKMFELGASKILRTAKQVRERWANYIDPDIRRDQWTDHDDQVLIKEMNRIGKRWSDLGKLLKRSENGIKNRYFTLMLRTQRKLSNESYQDGRGFEPTFGTDHGQQSQTQKSFQDRECRYRDIKAGEHYTPITLNYLK